LRHPDWWKLVPPIPVRWSSKLSSTCATSVGYPMLSYRQELLGGADVVIMELSLREVSLSVRRRCGQVVPSELSSFLFDRQTHIDLLPELLALFRDRQVVEGQLRIHLRCLWFPVMLAVDFKQDSQSVVLLDIFGSICSFIIKRL
jgi:hypothetical protein